MSMSIAAVDVQHPSEVKVREEIARLSKRLKPAEKELEAERKRHREQQATIKRLHSDLNKIQAGMISSVGVKHQFHSPKIGIIWEPQSWNQFPQLGL